MTVPEKKHLHQYQHKFFIKRKHFLFFRLQDFEAIFYFIVRPLRVIHLFPINIVTVTGNGTVSSDILNIQASIFYCGGTSMTDCFIC
jgi:hypothetical protein